MGGASAGIQQVGLGMMISAEDDGFQALVTDAMEQIAALKTTWESLTEVADPFLVWQEQLDGLLTQMEGAAERIRAEMQGLTGAGGLTETVVVTANTSEATTALTALRTEAEAAATAAAASFVPLVGAVNSDFAAVQAAAAAALQKIPTEAQQAAEMTEADMAAAAAAVNASLERINAQGAFAALESGAEAAAQQLESSMQAASAAAAEALQQINSAAAEVQAAVEGDFSAMAQQVESAVSAMVSAVDADLARVTAEVAQIKAELASVSLGGGGAGYIDTTYSEYPLGGGGGAGGTAGLLGPGAAGAEGGGGGGGAGGTAAAGSDAADAAALAAASGGGGASLGGLMMTAGAGYLAYQGLQGLIQSGQGAVDLQMLLQQNPGMTAPQGMQTMADFGAVGLNPSGAYGAIGGMEKGLLQDYTLTGSAGFSKDILLAMSQAGVKTQEGETGAQALTSLQSMGLQPQLQTMASLYQEAVKSGEGMPQIQTLLGGMGASGSEMQMLLANYGTLQQQNATAGQGMTMAQVNTAASNSLSESDSMAQLSQEFMQLADVAAPLVTTALQALAAAMQPVVALFQQLDNLGGFLGKVAPSAATALSTSMGNEPAAPGSPLGTGGGYAAPTATALPPSAYELDTQYQQALQQSGMLLGHGAPGVAATIPNPVNNHFTITISLPSGTGRGNVAQAESIAKALVQQLK
ncbi:MAG TPA: hypothetical protein VNM16_00200, partial [Bacillota bacterium]|nr:hypothetical protein [Bacillota bacterium]